MIGSSDNNVGSQKALITLKVHPQGAPAGMSNCSGVQVGRPNL